MLYKIGDFSKKVGLSIRTLRYYDEINLFKPVEVDLFTGYRYYSDEQIYDLEIINSLKDIGFTLDEIKFNWNNFSEELFIRKKEELLNEIEIKNNAIKKIDEFRSNINNGTFKKKSKRDNEKKVLYFERM